MNRTPFGDWIVKKIHESPYKNQCLFAEAAGVSQAAVSRWANGTLIPSKQNRVIIANLLNVSLEEIAEVIASEPIIPLPSYLRVRILRISWTEERAAIIDDLIRAIEHDDSESQKERANGNKEVESGY